MFNVLIVCTANVCRSPLGEVILKKMVREEDLNSLIGVHSCGIWGLDGQKPSELAIQVANENDLDLSRHQARGIRPDIIKQADLILCMTPEHRQELIQYFPSKEKQIYTLKGFFKEESTPDETIADPIGMSLSFYRRVFQEIESEMKRILPVIKQLAKRNALNVK